MSNDSDQHSKFLESAFHVDSIDPVQDPTGGNAPWFRYVISQGSNNENLITGTKSGSMAEVRLQVADMVSKLNERFGKLQAKKR